MAQKNPNPPLPNPNRPARRIIMATIREDELNLAIAAALDGMRRDWKVKAEKGRVVQNSTKRPDIVIKQPVRPPVLIENEFAPARNAEKEAISRLGLKMTSGGIAQAVIALCSPAYLKQNGDKPLAKLVAAAEYKYALLTGDSPDEAKRFPENGWLTGSIADLAGFTYASSISPNAVRSAVATLQSGVQTASEQMDNAVDFRADVQKNIGNLLRQEYGDGEQTRRMVILIILNAFIFHDYLAGYEGIRSVAQIRGDSSTVTSDMMIGEWENILKINYWPIFHIARQLLQIIPPAVSRTFLTQLCRTASALVCDGVTTSHDLSGRVFQQLIADRKYLATFYTRPPSASLLARLAIPADRPFDGGRWKDDARDYTVADFACGTGTLLSAAYQRIAELIESEGGNTKKEHAAIMEQTITGCDVMPAAVHLTASMLSGMHPEVKFRNTRLYTMPYGKGKESGYAVGSLELLGTQSFLPAVDMGAVQQAGTGEKSVRTREIQWRSSKLVIMNPPYTSNTSFEVGLMNIPNPIWAGFGMSVDAQKKTAARSTELRKDTCAHGNAGIASDFVALADKMVSMDGTTAFVLPLSVLAGESWKQVRAMWADNYRDIRVVTIAAHNSDECSFSADTGMAEALFIGKKTNNIIRGGRRRPVPRRGTFIVLHERPKNEIEAGEYARIIRRAICGKTRTLEDAPVGGTRIMAGDSFIGEILDSPLPKAVNDSWGVSRIRDMSLAQTAHALIGGRFHPPGEKLNWEVPICQMGEFAERGFLSRDINGKEYKGKLRGPFDKVSLPKNTVPTYPFLWAHNAKKETRLIVAPDSEGVIRQGMEKRAETVWRKASRAHYNAAFRFNSQPLAAAMTDKPTVGGPAWPNVILKSQLHEAAYALWGNSTLGVLLYWWQANKQHSGRGIISISRIPSMAFLDLRELSLDQLAEARKGFNALKNRDFLPFYRAYEDDARKLLDEIILVKVLGLPKTILPGITLIREKLCREPSVRGDKKS